MTRISPSWNTDQGVYVICEYLGGKPECVSESKGSCRVPEVGRVFTNLAPLTDLDSLDERFELNRLRATRKSVSYS